MGTKKMTLRQSFALVWGLFAPRFITEDCAVDYEVCGEDVYLSETVPMFLVREGETFDGIVTIRCFNLFGIAIFPKAVGGIRPFVNPHAKKAEVVSA